MRDARAFMPTGKTVAVAANTTAANGILVEAIKTAHTFEACQYRVHNAHNTLIHFAYGASNTAAASAAVAANAGNNADSYPLAIGATAIITAPKGSYFTATSTVNGTFFVTPGVGF